MRLLDEEINLKEEIPELMDEIVDSVIDVVTKVIKGVLIGLIGILLLLIWITTPIWIIPRYLYKLHHAKEG